MLKYIILGEIRRKCSVCDQYQAVSGQPTGPQCQRGADVPRIRGVRHHRSNNKAASQTLHEGHGEDGN